MSYWKPHFLIKSSLHNFFAAVFVIFNILTLYLPVASVFKGLAHLANNYSCAANEAPGIALCSEVTVLNIKQMTCSRVVYILMVEKG